MISELLCRMFGHARPARRDLGLKAISFAPGYQCPRCGTLVRANAAHVHGRKEKRT
ncbi:hypothetical protein [Noviherbaspirillum galbum]|uniref:Uncharacterized protein n=1 Tax=Noviherbaspirillum galbum TaxID=2709383 RepID=A0A6B3SHR3_9BURK|nr:hypothetical protein [Noviherbaspirillum galbum]NEX60203.1 hypothetical protein [Noviherbaspirillum galbum]